MPTPTRTKEEIIKIIEDFSYRNDQEILKDIGDSAPYPAPCSRKTCNILVDRLKERLDGLLEAYANERFEKATKKDCELEHCCLHNPSHFNESE